MVPNGAPGWYLLISGRKWHYFPEGFGPLKQSACQVALGASYHRGYETPDKMLSLHDCKLCRKIRP